MDNLWFSLSPSKFFVNRKHTVFNLQLKKKTEMEHSINTGLELIIHMSLFDKDCLFVILTLIQNYIAANEIICVFQMYI